jgi:hypothetical protein
MGFRTPLTTATDLDTGGTGQRVVISKTGGQEGGGAIELYPNTSQIPGLLQAGTDAEMGGYSSLSSPPRASDGRRSLALLTRSGGIFFSTPGPFTVDASDVSFPRGTFYRGAAGVLVGTAPPAGAQLRVMTVAGLVTGNAAGDATVLFPEAFPNGLLGIDVTELPNPISAGPAGYTWQAWGPTLSSVNLRCFRFGAITAVANPTLGVSVTLLGW